MTTRLLAMIGLAGLLAGTVASTTPSAAAADSRCYELRIYHVAPGKLDDLHQRFRNHAVPLLERHGVDALGFWVPLYNSEDTRVVFLLAHRNQEAREAAWKAFGADADWQAAYKTSEANGPLVLKADVVLLGATDYSPRIEAGAADGRRVFELRDYTASPGNLGHLNARFRDHTVELFAHHGMKNWGYWNPLAGQPGHDNRLVYLITHASADAAKASFKAFGEDPKWKAAREASEKTAGGSLTVQGGVKSTFLVPTDYSPTR